MSVVDSLFLMSQEAPSQVAEWLVEAAGCEVVGTEHELVRLRLRAEAGGEWLGLVVQANKYVLLDPEPDEVQAMDRYQVEVQVRGGGSDGALHRETGLLFLKLVASRPESPMMLVHNLDTLVAAHLPGAGVHTFDPSISPDADDVDKWGPWAVS